MGSSGPVADKSKIIVLFDGVCNLCNGAVRFIVERDPKAKFVFASLQSDFGIQQLTHFGLDTRVADSIVVIENALSFQKSEAALKIVAHLSGIWPWLRILRYLPVVVRDLLYDFVARHRYSVFGRSDRCMIPGPSLKARFVE